MLSEIQKFSNSEVFFVTLDNEPEKTRHWFRATEICDLLFSKSNSLKYVQLHCKDWQYREFQVGKGRPALYVCESGVYRMILRSKAPIALDFQDWLTEEILPKLRANNVVMLPSVTGEAIAEEWEAQGKEIQQLKQQLFAISATKQKASFSELELMIANRNVAAIEAELLLRGTRMTKSQKELVLQGRWLQ